MIFRLYKLIINIYILSNLKIQFKIRSMKNLSLKNDLKLQCKIKLPSNLRLSWAITLECTKIDLVLWKSLLINLYSYN